MIQRSLRPSGQKEVYDFHGGRTTQEINLTLGEISLYTLTKVGE